MKSRGFTLVEMMVVISIIAILAAIAAPSFSGTLDRMRVRKTADFMVQLINTARSEALRRNANVYLEVSAGAYCLGTTTPCTGDIHSDNFTSGVTLSATPSSATFDYIRGLPPSTGVTYTVTGSTSTKTVTVNMLGLVKVTGS